MSVKHITIRICQCSRCEYEWEKRKNELPKRCPRCGSWNWNKPKCKTA